MQFNLHNVKNNDKHTLTADILRLKHTKSEDKKTRFSIFEPRHHLSKKNISNSIFLLVFFLKCITVFKWLINCFSFIYFFYEKDFNSFLWFYILNDKCNVIWHWVIMTYPTLIFHSLLLILRHLLLLIFVYVYLFNTT